jgi:hypothetical protein
MPHKTTLPYSVPQDLQGKIQEGFQGGKAKVIELFENKNLKDVLKQIVQLVLPLKSAKWFVLDCAKFVLPRYEEQYPNDDTITKCIEVANKFLKLNSIPECALDDILLDALESVNIAYSDPYAPSGDAAWAANAVYCAVSAAVSNEAQHAAAYYAADATPDDEMESFVKSWIDQYFAPLQTKNPKKKQTSTSVQKCFIIMNDESPEIFHKERVYFSGKAAQKALKKIKKKDPKFAGYVGRLDHAMLTIEAMFRVIEKDQ